MRKPNLILDGASLVWRHQRLVWWIFLVSLVLGWMGSLAPQVLLSPLLDTSLASKNLVERFDLATFAELAMRPEVPVPALAAGSALFAFIFLIYMLFIDGGVYSVYHQDRHLSRAEFFERSGEFFWRMARLALFSLVFFGILASLAQVVDNLDDRLISKTGREMLGFSLRFTSFLILAGCALFVRLWFDLTQLRTVVLLERGMVMTALRSLGMTLRNAPQLLGSYLVISVLGWIVAAIAAIVWVQIPHRHFAISWILLEIVTLFMVAIRLWQRAAVVLWYESFTRERPIVAFVTPRPLEIVDEPEQAPTTEDSTIPGTETL